MCGKVRFFNDVSWTRAVTKYYGNYANKIGTFTPHYNISSSKVLLEPFDPKLMEVYKVSAYVNSRVHDDRKGIKAVNV